jgi:4-aminobutyrate aminotransferase
MRPHIKTKIPGVKSDLLLRKLKRLNVGYDAPYPFIHSREGDGCYFKDIDGNIFLDFSSQIASNPLGYRNKMLERVSQREGLNHPVKFAGQDFIIEEQVKLLEELISITPKGLNMAFLNNSGAEAVENCLKMAMRKRKHATVGFSFHGAFHGRTIGALSCTDSKPIQKKNFWELNVKHLPYDINALYILEKEAARRKSGDIGFVILETIQGEGGYRVISKELIQGIRKFCDTNDVPMIIDEVQSGLGRTGKWWASEHFNVKPDLMSSAKALQVGASITSEKFMTEPGSISSTWGGGSRIDLALGLESIREIKRRNLLANINNVGLYLKNSLSKLPEPASNVRGLGLMLAFDMPSKQIRNNLIIECLQNGLVLLGCGNSGVRVIPPYIVSKKEVDQAMEILESAILKTRKSSFKHKGKICNYLSCGEVRL